MLVKPSIDPNNAQLLAHNKREANRKASARKDLQILTQQLTHFAGELAAANTGPKDMERTFKLQKLINEKIEKAEAEAELELSINKAFELKGEEGSYTNRSWKHT